jgi:hypothetical protein
MRITQILESVSVGGMGTNSVATAPSKNGKMIRRQKPSDNALDSGKLFQETNAAEGSLEEVSQQTLQSYRKKASAQKRAADDVVSGDADDETWKKNVNLSAKRRQGIDAANKRLGAAEGVAGPEKCWPGHRKVGTKPGTGKNAGKRVNDCEKIKEDDVEENKKGVRAVKHTVKPRNFVAKNAAATTSGAGAHKDKKKAMKQGDVKHKGKEPAYESKLWAALERKIIK